MSESVPAATYAPPSPDLSGSSVAPNETPPFTIIVDPRNAMSQSVSLVV